MSPQEIIVRIVPRRRRAGPDLEPEHSGDPGGLEVFWGMLMLIAKWPPLGSRRKP